MNANRAYYALLPLLNSRSVLSAEKIKISKTFIRPAASFGTESWTLNEGIAKRLAAFERKIFVRMFGGNKVNENGRKRYNKELLQLLGDLNILSFARISQLNWLGHVNIKDNKRKVSHVSNNNPQGSRLRGRPKNRWCNCVQTDINKCKITNSKERSKADLDWESPLRRRRTALDWSAI
jgi:hypothetical protein